MGYLLGTDWLVGCFGFNGPLRQYFSLYRAVSQREGERGERIDESKNVQTTPTRTYCKRNRPLPYCNQNCRTPRHWKFSQHHRTTRPRPLGTEERFRNSRGKRAISVQATEVLLYTVVVIAIHVHSSIFTSAVYNKQTSFETSKADMKKYPLSFLVLISAPFISNYRYLKVNFLGYRDDSMSGI